MRFLGTDVVVDVGANVGQYIRQIRANGFRGTIIAFEPLPSPFEKIAALAERDPQLTVHRLAIGERKADRIIHIAANSYSSSLLAMNDVHLNAEPESIYVGQERVEVQPLDALDLIDQNDVAWLKVDTQGYEGNVLDGARRTLRHVLAVEIELTYVALYEDQALAWEIHNTLSGLGFDLVAFGTPFYDQATSKLLQIDGIFIQTGKLAGDHAPHSDS